MLSAERCGGEKGYEGQKGIKMANEKQISTIERALGIIEGVATGLVVPAHADMLITAVEMIEGAVKEITDGK